MPSIETVNSTTVTTTTYRMNLEDDLVKVEFERAIGESWMPVTNTITSIWVKIWGCPDYIDILPYSCELRDTKYGEPIFDLQDDIIKCTRSILSDLFTPFLHIEEKEEQSDEAQIYAVDDEDDEEEGFKW